jgi:hypothetical protein
MAITRDQWRERLLKAGIPEEVVNATLESLKDEDFARMKDMNPEQLLQELTTAKAVDAPAVTGTEEEVVDVTVAFEQFRTEMLAAVKDLMDHQEMTLELPALDAVASEVAGMKATLAAIKDTVDRLAASDEDRILALAKDISPASKARLVIHQKPVDLTPQEVADMAKTIKAYVGNEVTPTLPGGATPQFRPVVRDAAGREYADLGNMIHATQAG